MPFYTPQAEDSPTYPGQAILDACDMTAITQSEVGTGWISGGSVTASGIGMTLTVASVIAASLNTSLVNTGGSVTASVGAYGDRRDVVTLTSANALAIVQGTPCAVPNWATTSTTNPPVKPAIPSTSVLLWELYVPGGATTVANTNLIDKRVALRNDGVASVGVSRAAVQNETTVFTGAVTAQTITLPAAPPMGTTNTVINNGSVSLTIAAGGADTISSFGTTGNITCAASATYQLIYNTGNTTWYMIDTNNLADMVGTGSFGSSTATTQAALNNSTKLATTAYADTADGVEATLIGPQQNGYKAWTCDPGNVNESIVQPTKGTVYYTMIVVPQAFTLANIDIFLNNAAAGLSTTYLGIYSTAGTRLAVSADLSSTIGTSTGKISCPISYTFTAPGIYWVGLLIGNGSTTSPYLVVYGNAAGAALANINLTNGSGTIVSRCASGATGQTSLPSPISGTPTAVGPTTGNFFYGLH